MDIYTDGGCHGNPGPGGWGCVLVFTSGMVELKGHESFTTNNRMELTAVIRALEHMQGQPIVAGEVLRVHTDSQYVQQGISNWIHGWIRNGWRTASKEPVKNKDLWIQLHELAQKFSLEWKWVRGHNGDPLNERCDQLVQAAIQAMEQ